MAENLSEEARALARLVSFSRNKYFYGKMLTERELTLEQCYMNRKRWLINRLGLGSGVLCGLEVEPSEDGTRLLVHPGVAIDPLGREILVPEVYCLANLRQPTDCLGNPSGNQIQGAATLYVCLCYHECNAEPVPVLVSDCDTRQGCAANLVRERYCLRLCTEIAARPGLPCGSIFPVHPTKGFDHRLAADKAISGDCPVPAMECVVLADVILPADPEDAVKVDMFAHRTVLFSNQTLFDLLICLADQMETCCQVTLLNYVSGDAQSGQTGSVLKDALVVKVVDGSHAPVQNEPVTFKPRGGGGLVPGGAGGVLTVNSGADGMAKATWQLGSQVGLNTLEASIPNGSNVVFAALAQGEIVHPPVIVKAAPANGAKLTLPQTNQLIERGLEFVFNRNMSHDTLAAPGKWLGAWFVRRQRLENNQVISLAYRVQLDYHDRANGGPALDALYALKGWEHTFPDGIAKQGIRVLVMAIAQTAAIVSDGDKVLLDAEFQGTQLDVNQHGLFPDDPGLTLLQALQKMNPGDDWKFSETVFTGLSSPGNPPVIPATGTGDGTPGGLFHSYFALY